MRRIYAVEFRTKAQDPAGLVKSIQQRCETYLAQYVKSPQRTARADDDALLWTLNGTLPDHGDTVTIRLARNGSDVGFALDMYSPDAALRPNAGITGHLAIVNDIVDMAAWTNDLGKVEHDSIVVKSHQVTDFVRHVLKDPGRNFPAVVVSKHSGYDEYVLDDRTLAQQLAGVARVYALADRQASYELATAVTETLGCHNGACRIYWPGFTTRDSRYDHALLFGDELLGLPPGKAEDLIRGRIFAVAKDHFLEGPIHAAAKAELGRRAKRLLDGMGLDDLRRKARTLQEDVEHLQAAHADVQAENSALQALLAKASDQGVVDPSACRTAEEILRLAAARLPGIEIGPAAWKASRNYQSRHLGDLYNALDALQDLVMERIQGSLGQSLEAYFLDWGRRFGVKLPKFSPHESETTEGLHGDERRFPTTAGPVQMSKHFTIGKGDSQGCIQLYWEFSAPNAVVVGYVGPHLRYATM